MIQIVVVVLFSLLLRAYGIWWDAGYHFHPDERMLLIVADRLKLWTQLNPDFFNYGSLPIYILRFFSQGLGMADYQNMLFVGRFLSIGFECITLVLIYKISILVFKHVKIAYLSVFIYGILFFPIQNAHFFVVDVPLTTFVTFLLYRLLLYEKHPQPEKSAIVGLAIAASLATKFTSLVFIPVTGFVFISKHLLKKKKEIKLFFVNGVIFGLTVGVLFTLFMPYAVIDHIPFINDITQQLQMNSNPYIFPYTLQYVGTPAYFYYLKNIFLFGAGPIACIFALFGLLKLIKNYKTHLLIIGFYVFYFVVIGRSSVKFMRYMLPLYPFIAMSAAFGIYEITRFFHHHIQKQIVVLLTCSFLFAYSLIFISIYSRTSTRIAATDWVLKNIKPGSVIATEHWDDRLPLTHQELFTFQELTLYDLPDNNFKWTILYEKLRSSQYIIVASNRLYTPLQKLADCNRYIKCYPKTATYYKNLLNGTEIAPGIRFQKVKEFVSYPHVSLLGFNITLNDDAADESFTVYDHPKIMIFKRAQN